MCNRHIRWEFLLNRAIALGADYMATGHYARVQRLAHQPVRLLRGKDSHKDQSYVLAVLDQQQLDRAVFARIKDSQDLCFLAGENYQDFLIRYRPQNAEPGEIVNLAGEVLGEHNGLAFYTIGQRKGLGIAHPEPLYVIKKDSQNNILVVGTRDEMGHSELVAGGLNWVSGLPRAEPFTAEIKIRYSAAPVSGVITPLENQRIKVQFDQPLRDITPGQAAVAYQGEEAVVSGIIESELSPAENHKPVRLIQ
jgi:tRNA-specific 2-thiouridylase